MVSFRCANGEIMSKQMRLSDKHFEEIGELTDKLRLKRSEIIGLAIGILKSLSGHKAKSIKLLREDGTEVELILPVDLSK